MKVSPLLFLGLVALSASGQPVVTARSVQVLGSSVRSTAPVAGDGSAMGDSVPLALPALAVAESRFERHACVRRHRPPDHPWSPTLDARQKSLWHLPLHAAGALRCPNRLLSIRASQRVLKTAPIAMVPTAMARDRRAIGGARALETRRSW